MSSRSSKVIAIINIGLFLFLSYRIYQQEQIFAQYKSSKSKNIFQQNAEMASVDVPDAEVLLSTIASDAEVDNRLKAIAQLPREANEAILEQLFAILQADATWLHLKAIGRIDVKENTFRYMANHANHIPAMIDYLTAEVSNASRTVFEREQAFRYLFISLGQMTRAYAEAGTVERLVPLKEKLEQLLAVTMNETIDTLPAISVEGMNYLRRENAEQWPFPQLESMALALLADDDASVEVRLDAIQTVKQWKLEQGYPYLKAIVLGDAPDAPETLKIEALNAASALAPEETVLWLDEIETDSAQLELAIFKLE